MIDKIISVLPNQFLQAIDEVKIKLNPETKRILFCAMGGSAFPANLCQTFLNAAGIKSADEIIVPRDYNLPTAADSSWAAIFSSYSGNTEETLSALNEAKQKGVNQIIIFAHSGELQKISQSNGYPLVQIPDFVQPRLSYGYIMAALLKILADSGLADIDFDDIRADVKKYLNNNGELQSQGQKLAETIKGKIPIIYSSCVWRYVAMVWKINFNENAKTQAFWNVFPELNHNEMVGFTNLIANYKIIILKDPADHPRNQKRMDIFKQILGDKLNVEIIALPDKTAFYKMLYGLMLGLWTSYYLALAYEIDPAPVALVEEFKKLMAD